MTLPYWGGHPLPSRESSCPLYKQLLPGSAEAGVQHLQGGKTNGGHGSESAWQEPILTFTEKSVVKIHISFWLLVFIADYNFWSASVSEIEDKL